MIREQIWQALEPALREAKHSQAGAPGAWSDREFLEAVLDLNRSGCAMPAVCVRRASLRLRMTTALMRLP